MIAVSCNEIQLSLYKKQNVFNYEKYYLYHNSIAFTYRGNVCKT